jgi:hypothetical protein
VTYPSTWNSNTRLAYILGVPLADRVERRWPQMGEVVRTRELVSQVEGNLPEFSVEVGRRLQVDDAEVVESCCDYGDGRLYRKDAIGEREDGMAVRVTDYWGVPTDTSEWRQSLTAWLEITPDGIWPDANHLTHR